MPLRLDALYARTSSRLFYICLAKPSRFLHKDSTYKPPALPSTHLRTVNTIVASVGPSFAASHKSSHSALPPVRCFLSLTPRHGASRRLVRVLTTGCVVRVPARRRNSFVASGYAAAADLCSRDNSTGRRWRAYHRL